MAKKFFNNKVYNKKKNIITIVILSLCVIGVVVSFIVTATLMNKPPEDAIIKLHNSIDIEINTKIPENDIFFEELKNVDTSKIEIDSSDIKIDTLGKYTAEVKIYNEKHDVTVNVIDLTKPVLVTKDYTIQIGESYSTQDFVDNCSDNSKEKCNINFFEDGIDELGNPIDYSLFTELGTYEIKIVASDGSKNQSVESANLIITQGENPEPDPEPDPEPTCNFGNLEYDEKYILAYIIGNNNCAIDLNLYQNEEIRKPVIDIAEAETTKLKTDINAISGLSENITINREINAILNLTGNGVVGYTLFIEVLEADGSVIVKYNLNLDGNRVYIDNPYNLK